MRFHVALIAVCLTLSVSALSQDTPATKTADDQQVKSSNDSKASVYFYRYKQFVGSALSPSVYCDEGELARLENGRFFTAKLTPGKHVLRANDKQSGIEAELKGGQEYYVRVELVAGALKGHGRLVLVQPEQGAYEIKKLKPLDPDRVKNSELVSSSPTGQ